MASIISQTREQIRGSVGRNLKAVYVTAASGVGTTSTFVDNTLEASDNYLNGRWAVFTSGTNDGLIRPISDYVGSTTTATVRGAVLTAATASADTLEIWDRDVRPVDVHDAINRAIRAVPRKGAPDYSDETIHTAKGLNRFAIPSTVIGIRKVEFLSQQKGEDIESCEDAWDEQTVAGVTVVLDDEDCRQGGGSVRIATATIGATAVLASEVVSLDLSGYTHAEFWMKSSIATAAGDLTLRLSATADGGAGTEDLAVPALVANTWKRYRVALANPHLDTAIISVALYQKTDLADAYFWVDHVRSVVDNTGMWVPLSRNHWQVDSSGNEIDFVNRSAPGYHWLKLTGASAPTELDADATACDVDPEYVIAQATAFVIRATGDRLSDRREAAHTEADRWEAIAMRRAARMKTPQGMRWVG